MPTMTTPECFLPSLLEDGEVVVEERFPAPPECRVQRGPLSLDALFGSGAALRLRAALLLCVQGVQDRARLSGSWRLDGCALQALDWIRLSPAAQSVAGAWTGTGKPWPRAGCCRGRS